MRYWTQVKAPAGNYYDSVGTDNLSAAIRYAKYEIEQGREARVIERTDKPVWGDDS